MSHAGDAVRRLVDVIVGGLGLVVLAPVWVVVALVVRVRLGSPVLFRQRRLGRGGAPFELIKFRTMLPPTAGREGPQFDAERLPAVGRFLRSTSLDELPSFVNLLRGDITLVGPRPLPVHYWDRYTTTQLRRLEVKPGITGLAQVAGRNAVDWPHRLALDVEYVEQRSLALDARILLRTSPLVFGRHGVDHAQGVTMHELPIQHNTEMRHDTDGTSDG